MLAALAPVRGWACAACYGPNIDSPMADGMNWAIFTLGAIIVTVLGAFLTFLVYAIRRSEAIVSAAQPAAATGPTPPLSLTAEPILSTETSIPKPA